MIREKIWWIQDENDIEERETQIPWVKEYHKLTIWTIVDKSNAVWEKTVLAPMPYLKIKKRPEEIAQAKTYEVINQIRHFLWLAKILPPTPFYKKR
jgi:hypothetical protein